ncbi:MAG: D-alanine--D-alanine ligase [Pseudonocardiales bacterium]|nr:D-alanine--D-alanine ligase [Pseudonocardiales bacterium]
MSGDGGANDEGVSKVRVAVVYGGRSSEHSVSTVSAGSVLKALDPAKYDVVTVGITQAGQWVVTEADPARMQISGGRLPQVESGVAVVMAPDPTSAALVLAHDSSVQPGRGAGTNPLDVDVVFPVLHGRFGEDGTIQGLLEMAGVPYVGAGVFASAAAMDKEFTKKLLFAAGLAVGRYRVLKRKQTLDERDRADLGLPVFVKPARAGSSVGITKVRDWSEFDDALSTAFEHDDKVLVEAGVVGREVECGVLERPDGTVSASVPAEIRLVGSHDWYDFEAKYLDDACEFDIPADLGPELTARIQALAIDAFAALDCAGLARVDFFVTAAGECIVNEINTMPGFTPISMYPRMWAATGVTYPELIDTLVSTALRRGGR